MWPAALPEASSAAASAGRVRPGSEELTDRPVRRQAGERLWPAALLFLLLAIIHTWPLATNLSHLSRFNADEWLNAWVLSWIAHQLPSEPWRLFDANMFHPHAAALAYTEPLIVPGLLGAPIRWLGGTALLAHNVLVLLGFSLTAIAMHTLVRSWTGDYRAGLLAGVLFAFSTVFLTRTSHVQALHAYWLPLSILAFQRLLTHRRTREAAWLGLCVIGAALTSGYLVIFVTFALGTAALMRIGDFLGRDGVRLLLRLSAAALVTVAILVAVLRPYLEADLQRRPAVESEEIVTALSSYLASAANVHYGTWSADYYHEAPGTLFPGVVALALAAAALRRRRSAAPRGTRRMLVAVAVVGVVLSLGALTPLYAVLYESVPPLQSLRAVHRFGILVTFALAALAGIGFSRLRWPAPRWRNGAALVLVVLATVESFHGPIPYRRLDYAGRVHHLLARSTEPGAVVELPMYRRHRNARYLLASTVHWRPLVNGYGGFAPPDYGETVRLVNTFPSAPAIAWLRDAGVRHVVIHTHAYRDPTRIRRALYRAAEVQRDLGLAASDGTTLLYRIRSAATRAIEAQTRSPDRSHFPLRGTHR